MTAKETLCIYSVKVCSHQRRTQQPADYLEMHYALKINKCFAPWLIHIHARIFEYSEAHRSHA